MKLISDLSKLNATAKRVIGFAQGNQTAVHRVLCSYLSHVDRTGDIRPLKAFITAMPESARKNSMNKWCETFGRVTFEGNAMKFDKTAKTRLGEAIEKPYWKFKAVAENVPYKPMEEKNVIQFIKRLEKDVVEMGPDSEVVHYLKALKQAQVSH